jgi:ferredoxin
VERVVTRTAPEVNAMRVPYVDPDLCQGAYICESIAPRTFKVNDEGVSEVVNPTGDEETAIQQAIDSCPYGAISWKEA